MPSSDSSLKAALIRAGTPAGNADEISAAVFQAPVSGAGIGPVAVTGVPTAGQVPVAVDATNAAWATPSGGGGSPGGSTLQLQYNSAGAFAGTSTLGFDVGSSALVKTMDGAGTGGTLWKTVSTLNPVSPGYSQQWREGTFPVPFVYTDFVMNIGYNWSGTSRSDAAFPAQFLQLEAAYQLNNSALASQKVTEMHWNHVSVDGRLRRPISFLGAWDGEFLNVGMSGSQTSITDLAANNRLVGYYLNGETTLNGAINSSTTTVVLANARTVSNGTDITVMPEGANTIETMTVVSGGGTTTLTVTRGTSGTTASAHASGAAVLLPAASLVVNSSFRVYTDEPSPFILANAAGTINWLVVNSAGSTLKTSLAITAGVQNLGIFTNSSSGTASIQLKANNGAKTGSLSVDAGGSMVLSANGQGGATYIDCGAVGFSFRSNAYATILTANAANQIGVGHSAQSAILHIKAGTATAGTAPLKLTSGTNLTTPENGAFEYDGTNLYFTTGGTRKTVTIV